MELFPTKCHERATLRKLWRQTGNSSLLPAVARHLSITWLFFHRLDPFALLYNKSLNDWSLGEQWILFPSNLNVSLDFVSGNLEILGKPSKFTVPPGPVIKCLIWPGIFVFDFSAAYIKKGWIIYFFMRNDLEILETRIVSARNWHIQIQHQGSVTQATKIKYNNMVIKISNWGKVQQHGNQEGVGADSKSWHTLEVMAIIWLISSSWSSMMQFSLWYPPRSVFSDISPND